LIEVKREREDKDDIKVVEDISSRKSVEIGIWRYCILKGKEGSNCSGL
jgi:hypothetical protein